MPNAHKIFVNTLLLTAASLVMRGVGLAFQLYLAGRIGAAPLGVYSLMMTVYTMFVTLGSGGIRFAVTRLTAAALASGGSVRRTVFSALAYALGTGLFACAALFFAAPLAGERWIGSPSVTPALRLLAASLPFISVTSVLGGYFTGVERVVRSVSVNILEQLSRIAVAVTLLGRSSGGVGGVCSALAAAAVFGEAMSCLCHGALFAIDIRRLPRGRRQGGYGRRMISTAMPIAVSAYMRTGLSSLGHILIPRGLRASGASFESAFAAYGVIHGMVFPALLFPSALLTALAELIIPRLTAAQSEGRERGVSYMTTRVIKIGFLFSVCVAGIMFFFGGGIGLAAYKSAEAGRFMRVFAPLVPVMYCDMVTDGCLKGLGQHMQAMYINIAEATLNVLLLWLLVPRLAVLGYGISIYVCESFNLALSFGRLLKVTRVDVSLGELIKTPLAAAVAGLLISAAGLGLVCSAAAMAAAYTLLLCFFGVVAGGDVAWFKGVLRGHGQVAEHGRAEI